MTPPPQQPEPQRRLVPFIVLIAAALAAVALAASFALPLIQHYRHPDPAIESLSQARRIYNACQAYAAVRGHLPSSLEDLVPDFLNDRHDLGDPAHPEEGEIGYHYYASGATGTEPPETIFLASKNEIRGQRVIVRFDGLTKVQAK